MATNSLYYQPEYRSPYTAPAARAAQFRPAADGKLAAIKLRLFFVVAAFALCVALGGLLHVLIGDNKVQAAANSNAAHRYQAKTLEQTIVQPGDTLWSIAEGRIRKGEDIRAYIEKLKQTNGLASSAIQAGQVLKLP